MKDWFFVIGIAVGLLLGVEKGHPQTNPNQPRDRKAKKESAKQLQANNGLDLARVVERAENRLAAGFPSSALAELRQAYAARAKLSLEERKRVALLLGAALIEANQPEEALEVLGELRHTNEVSFWRGRALQALDRLEEAIKCLGLVGEDAPEAMRKFAAVCRARAYEELGKTDAAVDLLKKWIQRSENGILCNDTLDCEVVFTAAELELKRGLLNEAIGLLEGMTGEGVQEEKLQLRRKLLLAQAWLESREYARAHAELGSVQFEVADVALLRAQSLLGMGRGQDAVNELLRYLRVSRAEPRREEVFRYLDGMVFAGIGLPLEEMRSLSFSGGDSALVAGARVSLAVCEAQLGRLSAAREALWEQIVQAPLEATRLRAVHNLAQIEITAGQGEKALEVLERYGSERRTGLTYFLRGLALAQRGQAAEAVAEFRQAMSERDLALAAAYNGAVCALVAGLEEERAAFLEEMAKLDKKGEYRQKYRLREALLAAHLRLGDAGKQLKELAAEMGQGAILPLAEWRYVNLDVAGAREELAKIAPGSPDEERAKLLEIFLAEEGGNDEFAEATRLAEEFLRRFPGSEFTDVVRLKLAEYAYRRGDFLTAKAGFDVVAQESAVPDLAGYAWYFAGKSATMLQAENSVDVAMECYEEAARYGGELALRARFEQALLQASQKRHEEAISLLEQVIGGGAQGMLLAEAMVKKGDNLFAMSVEGKKHEAVRYWQQVGRDNRLPVAWRATALMKAGIAQEELGQEEEALALLQEAAEMGEGAPDAQRVAESAAFEAGRILEKRKAWREAVALYERLGQREGSRSVEAKERAVRILLEQEIWK